MINERAKIILDFCFVKTPLEQWFKKNEEFDDQLRRLFLNDYKNAVNNQLAFLSGENNSVLIRHEMFHFCLFIRIVMQLLKAFEIQGGTTSDHISKSLG